MEKPIHGKYWRKVGLNLNKQQLQSITNSRQLLRRPQWRHDKRFSPYRGGGCPSSRRRGAMAWTEQAASPPYTAQRRRRLENPSFPARSPLWSPPSSLVFPFPFLQLNCQSDRAGDAPCSFWFPLLFYKTPPAVLDTRKPGPWISQTVGLATPRQQNTLSKRTNDRRWSHGTSLITQVNCFLSSVTNSFKSDKFSYHACISLYKEHV